MNVVFRKCSFSLNYADSKGGAIYMVGSTVEFDDTSFYLNQASSGGAIAMGPGSTAFILSSNFTSNKARKWGADVFLTTPVGSKVYLNRWPPESVAKFFPPQTNIAQAREAATPFAAQPAPVSTPKPSIAANGLPGERSTHQCVRFSDGSIDSIDCFGWIRVFALAKSANLKLLVPSSPRLLLLLLAQSPCQSGEACT